MPLNKTYQANEINFDLKDLPTTQPPRKVLLCTPEHFDIVDIKNVHMQKNPNLNRQKAQDQWQNLRQHYQQLQQQGHLTAVLEIEGAPGCEDMVFCANQSLPALAPNGDKIVFISRMKHAARQKEIPFFRTFYQKQDYKILELTGPGTFEGMGDAIFHPNRRLLYSGHGFRSDAAILQEVATKLQTPIIALPLKDPRFYHLDTCFLPLDETTVLICPDAFDPETQKTIQTLFKNVIPIPIPEAQNFALNAHCLNDPGNKTALIQAGNSHTHNILLQQGFRVHELETSEFIKAGGSIFCLKMMLY